MSHEQAGGPSLPTVSDAIKFDSPHNPQELARDLEQDYENPLEDSPRWQLSAKAYAIRSGAAIGFGILNRSSPYPTKTIWLNSTLSKWKGDEKIKVDIWEPLAEPKPKAPKAPKAKRPSRPGYSTSKSIARMTRNASSRSLAKLRRNKSSNNIRDPSKNASTLSFPDSSRNASALTIPESTSLNIPASANGSTTDMTSTNTTPESTTPVIPESTVPTIPESTTPTIPESTTPTIPESTTPTIPESTFPAIPESANGIASEPTDTDTTSPANPELIRTPTVSTVSERRTAIINFHGGGFILGQGSDDALWAGAVQKAMPDAIIFSVNYRLAPEYPYPTGTEDCADAIMQIAQRCEEFGVDPDTIFLSGFSAGATLSLASWVLLQQPQVWNYQLTCPVPKIAGMTLFYPSLDLTVTRPEKRLGCARPDQTLPKGMTDLFDASYIYPPIPRRERNDPRLSPGLMPDALLDRLPPMHFCLCGNDMLLAEGQRFVERVRAAGKEVGVRVVEGEKHAWDRMPALWPKENIFVEYGVALDFIRKWVGQAYSYTVEQF